MNQAGFHGKNAQRINSRGRASWRQLVRLVAALVFLLSSGSFARAQGESICDDPGDQQFKTCLSEIAKYTSWMVVPGPDNASRGDLQGAIEDVYSKVQGEWTGPLKSRTHVKWLYVSIPVALTLYLLLVWTTPRYFRPVFPPGGRPRWRAEKIAIIGGAVLFAALLIAENFYFRQKMIDQYDNIPGATEAFIHLRQPAELIQASTDPCAGAYHVDNLLLGKCQKQYADKARDTLGLLLNTSFASPALSAGSIAIGHACKDVPVPAWWESTDPGVRDEKLNCEVSPGIKFDDLQGLRGVSQWIQGTSGLTLEDIFNVQTGGRSGYREKAQILLRTDAYDDYVEQFSWASWPWIGLALILFLIFGVALYSWRKRVLEDGSARWKQVRKSALSIALVGGFVASVLTSILVLFVR